MFALSLRLHPRQLPNLRKFHHLGTGTRHEAHSNYHRRCVSTSHHLYNQEQDHSKNTENEKNRSEEEKQKEGGKSSDLFDFLNSPHETQQNQPSVQAQDVLRSVGTYTHAPHVEPSSNTVKFLAFLLLAGLGLLLWNLDYLRGHLKSKKKHSFDRLLAQMKIDTLISETTAAIEEDSKFSEAYYFRGLAYFMSDDYINALANFEKVIALSENTHLAIVSSALTYAGYAFSSLGQDDSALEVLNQALEINPKSVAALRGKGEVLSGKKDWTEALACYDKVHEIDPDDRISQHYRASLLHRLNKNEEALGVVNQLLAVDYFDREAQVKKAAILVALKKNKEALSWLNDILALSPDIAEALFLKGKVLEQERRPREALAAYERALYMVPEKQKLQQKVQELKQKYPD